MSLETWQYCDDHDTDRMELIVQSMRDFLSWLDDLPSAQDDNSRIRIASYCSSLVRYQRKNVGRTKPYSWSVAPDDYNMPTDARVDFIFTPTYLACAILTRTLLDFPWISIQISGYSRALKRGLHFCTYRELRGSGYESISGMLDAFVILSIGKVPVLLEKCPDYCIKLRGVFVILEKYLLETLLDGEAVGAWGEDLTGGYQSALETLYLYRDRELIQSVRSSKDVNISDFGDTLPW